jgi:formate hydrogenlyase subunit 5
MTGDAPATHPTTTHPTAEPSGAREMNGMWDKVLARAAAGERFAGLHGTEQDGDLVLTAHIATDDDVDIVDVNLGRHRAYPALTPQLGAAFWYERELHDLFGVIPQGHPRLDPLILPHPGTVFPRPGYEGEPQRIWPDEHAIPRHVTGPGLFTIPHGPVRSGVFESVEYLVETPGEEIPHVSVRPFYKHRGLEKRFEEMTVADGALLAERVEGIASVAHALAYCHAVERLIGCTPPWPARLVRVLHAELERVANHLDVAVKLADAAGLAVATARFGWHKERVMRLVGHLCGSRFGRGVVVPGGVSRLPALPPGELLSQIGQLEAEIARDARLLMETSSFLDRLRLTGPLTGERAREHGALGPVARASGLVDDARATRPYDAYEALGTRVADRHVQGDALARLRVRWDEITESFQLIRQAADELAGAGEQADDEALTMPVPSGTGRAVGWAEAPQGEVLYEVWLTGGRITRCRPRSASFHNLALFNDLFAGDILTDFPFIEASLGLSIAGVAR